MYTQCPECRRQFRIRADQLRAAAGEVKCGYCGNQFNALLTLRDRPLPPEEPVTDPSISSTMDEAVEAVLPEPEFTLPTDPEIDTKQADTGTANAPTIEAGSDADTALPEPHGLYVDDPAVPVSTETGEEQVDQHDTPAKESDIDGEANIVEPDRETPPHYVFPDSYLEDSPPPVPKKHRLLWGIGSVLLMLVLVTQVAWFYRDRVLGQYPQLTPYVTQLCEKLDCRITRFQEVEQIRLVNRDVREHPRYRDALLVNATMINNTDSVQPWPLVRLSLFDTNGKILSSRLFEPDEYLDDSIDRKQGMDVNVPVHFVLEVSGPTEAAVSFEFDFLER